MTDSPMDEAALRDSYTDFWIARSRDPNGYRREEAVTTLGSWEAIAALPALLERVNDWVPQVRSAARNAVYRLLDARHLDKLIECLPLLMTLKIRGRDQHEQLIHDYTSFLQQPEHRGRLKHQALHAPSHVSLHVIPLAYACEALSPVECVNLSLTHPSVILKYRALDIIRTLPEDDAKPLWRKALDASFMPVRREGFQQLLRVSTHGGTSLSRAYLFDPAQAIRSLAIQQLKSQDLAVDVESEYLNVLNEPASTPRRLLCALTGMADLGAKARTQTLARFLNSPYPKVRKASLQALARLLPETSCAPILLEGFQDESPAVAKEALRLMLDKHCLPPLGALLTCISADQPDFLMERVLGLSVHLNKWDRLIILLEAMLLHVEKLAMIERHIQNWNDTFNRSHSQPTIIQLDGIKTRLNVAEARSQHRFLKTVRFSLKPFGLSREEIR